MADIARVDGRYVLKEKLGTGSYAMVYRARDIITKRAVAVKLEPEPSTGKSIQTHVEHEYRVLSELEGGTGFPHPLWFGREGPYRVMVMDNLGPSLDELLKASPDGALRIHRVATLGLQMVSQLEYIHSNNFVHRDIKPQNLLMGLGDLKDTVFVIDFGIAKLFRHPSSRIHISPGSTVGEGKFVGTPAFASLNSHLGSELSRRDDLEALAYTLLFLCGGSLPWLNLPSVVTNGRSRSSKSSRSAIHAAKETFDTKNHPEMPGELLTILSYSRDLAFTQKPDYNYLRAVLLPATSTLSFAVKEMQTILVAASPLHAESGTDVDEGSQPTGTPWILRSRKIVPLLAAQTPATGRRR